MWGYLAEDGTAVLSGHGLSPTEAAGAAERLEQLAAAVRAAGHPHTETQLRADLFIRLLDGRYTGFTRDQIITAMLTDADPELEPNLDPRPVDLDAAEPDTAGPDAAESGDAGSGAAGSGAAGSGAAGGPGSGAAHEATAARARAASTPADSTPARGPAAAPEPAGAPAPDAAPATSATGLIRSPTADPDAAASPATQPPAAFGVRSPLGARTGIEVRIALTTLLGLDDHPAELPGWGPIDAQDARLLVARQHRAEWRFAILDDHSRLIIGGITRRRPATSGSAAKERRGGVTRGGVVELHLPAALLTDLIRRDDLPPDWRPILADLQRQYGDRHAVLRALDGHPAARFPTAGLRRHIQLRDRTCIAPGCRRPARKVEQDHTRDHATGGLTVRANLDPLCWRHHRMKHHGGWSLTQPLPGLFRWRSPLGQLYWTRAAPIAPDLPDPIPRPETDTTDTDTPDLTEVTSKPAPLPIFNARRRQPPQPPELDPRPPPQQPDDDDPPF